MSRKQAFRRRRALLQCVDIADVFHACEGRFPLFTLVDDWMITVDDSLQMNRYQSLKVIIQDEGWKKLAAANFGSLWVTHRNRPMKHPLFTACSSAVNNGCLCLLSGYLSIVLFENNLLWLLNGRTTTRTTDTRFYEGSWVFVERKFWTL
jgi:hypothetical protein